MTLRTRPGDDLARERAVAQAVELSAATRTVADASATVTGSMDELRGAFADLARDTRTAAGVADEAVQRAATTGERVVALQEASASIGDVVRVISSITQQSRMLALNATIEAARAGEAGRGFSVVASEVKHLAARTAAAAETIGAQVETLQAQAAAAAAALEAIAASVGQIAEVQEGVRTSVEQQSSLAGTVAASCAEVSRASASIRASVEQMAEARRVEYCEEAIRSALDWVAEAGGAALGEAQRRWTARDQVSGATRQVTLPVLLVAGQDMGCNDDPRRPSPVVDEVVRQVGGTCTVFQVLEDGALMRVATTIANPQGRRNVSSFIPVTGPDGAPTPVVREVLAGRTYVGPAMVAGKPFTTAYAPLHGPDGTLLGALYVGLPVED